MASRDSHHLQLPTGNFRAPNENATAWNKLTKQQRQPDAGQPVRPQTSRKIMAKPSNSLLSPRQKVPMSPPNVNLAVSGPASATVTSLAQCKSPRTHRTPFTIVTEEADTLNEKHRQRPASSPVASDWDQRLTCESPASTRKNVEPQFLLPINPHAREHIEIKACLLAHTHHLDVDELHRIRGENQLALNKYKMQRIIAQGGVIDGGSAHEDAKRKTTYLLRHFFSLHDINPSVPQEQLLCDAVEDWACGDQATSDDISGLWKSIDNHIEHSYLLQRKLVPNSDPDELSIVIAIDCLKKLPQRLPEYRRVLDVIIALVETGLYLDSSASAPLSAASPDPSQDDDKLPTTRKRFYFEEYRVLQALTRDEQVLQRTSAQHGVANCTQQEVSNGMSLRQRIESLFNQLREDQDKKDIFLALFRGSLSILSSVACEGVLSYYLGPNGAASADVLYSLLMKQIGPAGITRLLTKISQTYPKDLQKFAFESLDSLLVVPSATSGSAHDSSTPALFQQLVDRYPHEFAAILWRSPYLTAHIFQGSEHLVARVLEQNVYRISQVLTQRSDVLMPLLSHIFKENTAVLEEFLVNHPRGLADLLMNRSASIAAAVKAKPYILSDLLQACCPTLTKVLAATPEIVSTVIKSNPQVLPQIVREDPSILSAVFTTVPQCLGDTLEKNPEILVDVAHRKPALVSRLFAEHPDLLLEPLEANPALFTTFLVYHRSVLPDFSAPDFDPTVFKLRTKMMAETGIQVGNNLKQTRRKPRIREKLREQSEDLLESQREATGKNVTHTAVSTGEASLVVEENLFPSDIANEIARVYTAKIEADEQDDSMNRKRQSLSDFLLELYILELGFKPSAKTKLMKLLIAAKHVGNEPEVMRIKWFRRFLNVIPGDRHLPHTALDFYLAVLQHLTPVDQHMPQQDAGLFQACIISQSTLKTLVDDPLVSRLFDSKEQRQRLLSFQSPPAGTRQDMHVSTLSPLGLDDLLDMVMKIWMQHQLRLREEWAVVFQEITPDGTGIARFDAFATIVRSKFPVLDNRALMKVYNSCGEENDQGDFVLFSDDFTLAMSILQEQSTLHQYAASSALTTSSAQLSSLSLASFSTSPVSGRQ